MEAGAAAAGAAAGSADVLADLRAELVRLNEQLWSDSERRRKKTPEKLEAWRQYRREADERSLRARELYARGMRELEARRAKGRDAS